MTPDSDSVLTELEDDDDVTETPVKSRKSHAKLVSFHFTSPHADTLRRKLTKSQDFIDDSDIEEISEMSVMLFLQHIVANRSS